MLPFSEKRINWIFGVFLGFLIVVILAFYLLNFFFSGKVRFPLWDVIKGEVSFSKAFSGEIHKTDMSKLVEVEEGEPTEVGDNYVVFSGTLVEKTENKLEVEADGKKKTFIVEEKTTYYEPVFWGKKEPLFEEKKFSDLFVGCKVFVRYNKEDKDKEENISASRIGFQK